ncbi:aldo/keto reductase [Variovorax defluvii]|uniref:Aldo/keto reductase n=1 Tax=Variovorax defluvii TaxID=913761 RepID=A0ABP8HEV9_9BURK
MKRVPVGASGLCVGRLGLGCMGMSEFYGATDDAQSLEVMAHALDQGVTLFDTADAYGFGHNEELLGRFLQGRREHVVVATKFGLVRKPGAYERRVDNTPSYVRQACEASLRRLGIDCIDLYYMHRVSADTPVEDSVGAMADLVRTGKVKAIGLSEVSAATLRRAAAVHPIAAVQSEYSLWTRDPEHGVLQACRDVGAAFCAYSPLGRGFLTGKLKSSDALDAKDFRRHNPRFDDAALQQNLRIVEVLEQMASRKGCTPAQLALAWLLAQGDDVIPIPGTKRIRWLDENLAAASVSLDARDLATLDDALPPGIAQGERYSPEGMKGLDG